MATEEQVPDLKQLIDLVVQAGMLHDAPTIALLNAIATGGQGAGRFVEILMQRIAPVLDFNRFIEDPFIPYPENDVPGDVFLGKFFGNEKQIRITQRDISSLRVEKLSIL